jgi:hypothetical protein
MAHNRLRRRSGRCPLWVKSRHVQRTTSCLRWANSGLMQCISQCPLRATKRHQRSARDAEQRTSCRPPSIETVVGHAAVITGGVIAPPRSANVRPVIVVAVALQPPWGGIPPSAVVVCITAPTVPVPRVVCAKNLHAPLRVNLGRMLAKRGMLHDLRALRSCSVLLLNGLRTDAVLRCCSVLVLNATRAQPRCVHYGWVVASGRSLRFPMVR